jgi:hypothetical protein
MNVNIQYSATVTIDGEVRTVSGGETIEASNITTGSQTIGNTYEVLAGSTIPGTALLLYNTGTVDVAVRVLIAPSDVLDYISFNLIAGGVMCIPKTFVSDLDAVAFVIGIQARTSSSTAVVEYCHIY